MDDVPVLDEAVIGNARAGPTGRPSAVLDINFISSDLRRLRISRLSIPARIIFVIATAYLLLDTTVKVIQLIANAWVHNEMGTPCNLWEGGFIDGGKCAFDTLWKAIKWILFAPVDAGRWGVIVTRGSTQDMEWMADAAADLWGMAIKYGIVL
ncbi:hypothetical protein HDV00_011204, partial [Rhizophlyctis rosea]